MNYSRNLKLNDNGEDVFYIKNHLFSLGYYTSNIKSIKNKSFGYDTDKAIRSFQSQNMDLDNKELVVDGIIGQKTWNAIESMYNIEEQEPVIQYTRMIKLGMSGPDVLYMKECLFILRYYPNSITEITNDIYENETLFAVKTFQTTKGLQVDAIIGPQTWNAIIATMKESEESGPEETGGLLDNLTHISLEHRKAIEEDLKKVSSLRKDIVIEILNYAYDHTQGGVTRGLYIWAGNLYNTDLSLNVMTVNKIEAGARSYPNYYSGGRKEWMIEQIKRDPTLPGADCSGMEVGFLRKHKLVKNTFDASANTLCTNSNYSSSVSKSNLKPGDFVGKDGHIGTYVGGGLVVEFFGGAYGCQLTDLNKRQGYNFIKKKLENGSAWTRFRKPIYY